MLRQLDPLIVGQIQRLVVQVDDLLSALSADTLGVILTQYLLKLGVVCGCNRFRPVLRLSLPCYSLTLLLGLPTLLFFQLTFDRTEVLLLLHHVLRVLR